MLLKQKREFHKTIHDGAIGMKNPLVGYRFLKQAKSRVSDWSRCRCNTHNGMLMKSLILL